MTLSPGTRLGPYELHAIVGAGGMGEVYRARDLRLGREVALKVLPALLSADRVRLRRFELEARAAGALNHPGILTVFDVGQHEDIPYMAAELLAGATLRERLARGLPQRKALDFAIQIAHGLAAAHDHGIVHRDLKPENVFVTQDGRVKILDFGLAKLAEGDSGRSVQEARGAAQDATDVGVVLGTAGYMSPEQVRGLPADTRSDIFAFGSVLYEMLGRRRAFRADTTAETMAAVLREEPPSLSAIDDRISPALDRLVRRCLEKRPEERFQSSRDVAYALELLGAERSQAPRAGARRAAWLVAAAVAVMIAAASIFGRRPDTRQSRPARRVVVPLPATAPLSRVAYPFALSDDGRFLVYVRSISRAQSDLWLRPLDALEARPLAATEGALRPFFSPDGLWIGFWANDKLMKVPLAGGAPVTVCPARTLMGASWASDGSIVFAPGDRTSLFRVPAAGGRPEAVTALDRTTGELSHRMPQVLPGDAAVLFTSRSRDGDRIVVQRFASGDRRTLVEGARKARYDGRGHLIYSREGALYAVPFDPVRLEVTGPSALLVEGVVDPADGAAWFDVSQSGSLAYVAESPGMASRSMVLVDQAGSAQPLGAGERAFNFPRLSPDGRRIAFILARANGLMWESDLWTYDLDTNAFNRLTFNLKTSHPLWSPDGRRIAYGAAVEEGGVALLQQPADGSGPVETLLRRPGLVWSGSWIPGGRGLTYMEHGPSSGDILLARPPGEGDPVPIVAGPANEWAGYVSPDGRWLAYVSDESGRFEVYVSPLAGSETRRQISTDGGQEPVWSRDGRELFYRSGDRMMTLEMAPAPKLPTRPARTLFETRFAVGIPGVPNYDVGTDRRFLMIRLAPEEEQERRSIHLLLDWADELEARTRESSR